MLCAVVVSLGVRDATLLALKQNKSESSVQPRVPSDSHSPTSAFCVLGLQADVS